MKKISVFVNAKALTLAMLAVALVFGLTLAGCKSPVSGPETEGAQTYLNMGNDVFAEYDGNLTVVIPLPGGGSVNAGQIVNGKLTLELPQSVETDSNWFLSGLTVNPSGTTKLELGSFNVNNASGYFGALQYSYDIWGENNDIEERLNQFFFAYYSNDCTITGTSESVWNGVTITFEYNIKGKQGWNYIYHKGERTSPTTFIRTVSADIGSAPKEMKWVIRR